MNKNDVNTLLLGKLLGEVYHLQRKLEIPSADDATIFGLRNGFELVIDAELERIGFISEDNVNFVLDVLDSIDQDPQKLSAFKGFYDIEKELAAGGVDRTSAIFILSYLKANHQFTDIIAKMDSSDSPGECRRFEHATLKL